MIKKLLGIMAVLVMLTGCSVWDKRVTIYKVVKNGVVTFMTEEQIKEAKLDKINDFIVKVHEGNGAESDSN